MSNPARRRSPARNRRRPLISLTLFSAITLIALSAALFAGPSQDASLADAIAEQRNRAYGPGATAESLNDLGNLLVLDEQNQAAIEAYRRALDMDPSHLAAGFNLGLLLDSAGENQESLSIFQELLGFHPDHARTHYQVGSLLERAGRDRAAISSYVRAFELDPFLALPDVNPQITDNELVTEALLRVEVEADAQQDAPRIYSEPTRVASLLLSSEPEVAEAETAPAEGAVASDEAATLRSLGVEADEKELSTSDLRSMDSRSVESPTPSPAPDDEALLEGRRADLRARADDDEPEATTQRSAAPEAEAETPPSRTLSVRDLSTTRVNQAAPTAGAGNSRRSNARGSSRSTGRRPSTNRGSNTNRPRSSSPTRFRPGRRSSAQLDLRLVPQPSPATTAPAPARD
ncbi:MAG: tetratricopeptide repeat protein [Acidobacteriota bacterium]